MSHSIYTFLSMLLIAFSFQAYSCPWQVGGFTQGSLERISIDGPDHFLKRVEDRIDEEQFNQIIDSIAEFYRSTIEGFGAELVVRKQWEDDTLNAFADREGENQEIWVISMFGGLARHRDITPDGFAMVVCHEIGHHIAGYPRYAERSGFPWASSEGQSDYFAASKCLYEIFSKNHNLDYLFNIVHTEMELKCSKSFPFNQKKYDICVRTALAGQAVANFFASGRRIPNPEIGTPSQKIVKKHFNAHPQPQCRLDTYFQGSLCKEKRGPLFGTDDYSKGFCTRNEWYFHGFRPKCWFSPEQAELESFL